MKTTITLTLLAVFFTACSTTNVQSRYATDKFEVTPFTTIESSVVANIEIRQSSTTEVSAEGSEKLLDILEVRMDGDKLILDMEDRLLNRQKNNAEKLTIYISTPTLSKIEQDGVGNVEIIGTFSVPELAIDSEGVGNVSCHASEYLKVRSDGIGGVTYYGNPAETDLSKNGIGKIKAGN